MKKSLLHLHGSMPRTRLCIALVSFVLFTLTFSTRHVSADTTAACERSLLDLLNKKSFHEVLNSPKHDLLKNIKTIFEARSPEQQAAINEKLTKMHADREMSFQVKNPKTGNYDKFVAVPVNGAIAPIHEDKFKKLVESTEPVMRALRKLLQKIYSSKELTVASLGLGALPREEAESMLRVIKESIYLEPKLVHPNMASYPFLSIGAFDGAVIDPNDPKPAFFEMNLGTPSGLSNNAMLIEALMQADPQLGQVLKTYLLPEYRFDDLMAAIHSNALAWTNRSDGVIVAISPGIYNGAHPDVAMLARSMGIPLVTSSDLYEDKNGDIRLNYSSTDEKRNPIVTGIYGRMEESFFLQSSKDGVPLISPRFSDNRALGQRLGVDLRPGAIYKFSYDNNKIVDVERDAQGKPVLQDVWDTIGADPFRPDAPRGSFLNAVVNRRLYYSAIGGRVVDDKRLFRIITQYLIPKNVTHFARPIPSLKLSEYSKFYENPGAFVVKVPADSGGVGIQFPMAMTDPEVLKVIAQVRANPTDFEIQYVSDVVTLPESKNVDGQNIVSDTAIDLRLFVMMDAQGNVRGGSNSLLIRTAQAGSLLTNTSRDGGYGIGVVYRNLPEYGNHRIGIPSQSWARMGTPSADAAMVEAMRLFQKIKESVNQFERGDEKVLPSLQSDSLSLSFVLRGLMIDLDPELISYIGQLREFAHGEPQLDVDLTFLHDLAWVGLNNLIRRRNIREAGAFSQIQRSIDPHVMNDPILDHKRFLPTKATLRPLDEPEMVYVYTNTGAAKVELAEYTSVDDPSIQKIISEVRAAGGQVRFLRNRVWRNDIPYYSWEPPYFFVNLDKTKTQSYTIPVIAIDLSVSHALPALEHEFSHFKFYKRIYDRLRSEGMDHEAASHEAVRQIWIDVNQVQNEREAVTAEIHAEIHAPEGPYNPKQDGWGRPRHFYEYGYINRTTYPEFEGLLLILRNHNGIPPKENPLRQRSIDYMRTMVDAAITGRNQAVEFLSKATPEEIEKRKSRIDRYDVGRWKSSSIYSLLMHPYGSERLHRDNVEKPFNQLLKAVCREKKITDWHCGANLPLIRRRTEERQLIEEVAKSPPPTPESVTLQ